MLNLTEPLPWNLTHHRYCVVGVARSGTQLTEALLNYSIGKTFDGVVTLEDFMNFNTAYFANLDIDDNNKLSFKMVTDADGKLKMAANRNVEQLPALGKDWIDKVSRADPTQPLTCRIFLDDRLTFISLVDGLEFLKKQNFKFVYVNRNFEHKILSSYFAKKTMIFRSGKNSAVLTVDIPELKTMILGRYLMEEHNKRVMTNIVGSHIVVEYDELVSMAANLDESEKKLAFGIFNEKQLPLDPYEQIANSDEVKEVFATFYPNMVNLSSQLLGANR
jgi:hypothetical protein